jgi:hypothetical protein
MAAAVRQRWVCGIPVVGLMWAFSRGAAEVKEGLDVHFVQTYEEVYKIALGYETPVEHPQEAAAAAA